MASGDSNENNTTESVHFSDNGKMENSIFESKSDYFGE